MSLFSAFSYSKSGLCSYTISTLCLFQALLPRTQYYTKYLTTVNTALKCWSCKRTLFTATDMSLFGAFSYGKSVLCSYTLSTLCLFQAVQPLAQNCTICSTTVNTAVKCCSRKRTLFIATDMSLFSAFSYSKSGLCSFTISTLCLFQAVILLAQYYNINLTTINTALKCWSRKRTLFTATDMSLFSAFSYGKSGLCSYTISTLCLFQAVLLHAQY
jgi:hypothetical protein